MKVFSLLFVSAVLFSACKQATPTITVPQTEVQMKNEFQEVGAAMQAGKPVICLTTKTDGSSTMTSMMKDKKMKVTGMTVEGQAYQGSMISDGEFMYTWDDVKKEGVKLAVPAEEDIKELAKKQGQTVPDFTKEEDRTAFENQGYTIDCKVGTISDSEFIPPTDVKFTDMSAMMENVNKMMQDVRTDNGMDSEKIKKLQEQFGQQ